MEIERVEDINIVIPKVKKIREKKVKPMGYRELMALEMEERSAMKEIMYQDIRFIADCYYDFGAFSSTIKVYDTSFFREVAVFTFRGHQVMSSRVLTVIKDNYRITIKEEDFYDIRICRGGEEEQQGSDFFLI